jgi:hypothetical protein
MSDRFTRENPQDRAGAGEPGTEPFDPSASVDGSSNAGAPAFESSTPAMTRPPAGVTGTPTAVAAEQPGVDLTQRRDELTARYAELQWDLGGLVYEMAIRDHIRVDVLVRRAAILQDVDAELGEVERILRMEETGTAGSCASCGAPHSSGAVYCWQCGQPLLEHVASHTIST